LRERPVQLLAGNADTVGQASLDVHVHIFQLHSPLELAGLDFTANLCKAFDDLVAFDVAEHADLREHGGVGDRSLDVVLVEALVEVHRGGEACDEGVDRFAEPSAPGLIGSLVLAHVGGSVIKDSAACREQDALLEAA
jgi:hypothetical protein